ncbi:MAG: ABC transporter permease [Blastocatellia bacterium]
MERIRCAINRIFPRSYLWLIRFIGLIVPRRLRADWRQEWEAELRHREELLAEWDRLDWRNRLDLLRRSVGAFWDALLLQPRRLEDEMFQDLRFGVRMLLKHKGFTLIAVLTLSLGIGANTAIFSIVNAVLLRPLPFAEPERLVWFGGWLGADKEQGVTPADFLDYREQCRSFTQIAASVSDGIAMNLSGDGEPERIKGGYVTANYLDVFGVKPTLGRTFVAEEGLEGVNMEGGDRVVVLSRSLWQRRFGADPAIINQTITLDKRNVTVIGVMPPQFQHPPGVEIWLPFRFPASPQSAFRSREFPFLRPVARLKPGVTRAQAQAEVETIARRLQSLYPKTNANKSLYLMPLQERLVGNIRLTLLTLLGAVGCVLLIACANVANLLLARAATRQKEIAVRSALGASRGRVVRQLLTESLALALLGACGGALLAKWGVRLLVALSSDYLPRADEVRINATVFAFTLAVALLTGLLFGLAPALQSSRLNLTEALKEGGRGAGSGTRRHRMLNLLVVGEVALAMVLLIGAGLLVNSFVRLQQVNPGFDEKNLLTARIDIPNPYAQPEKKAQFFEQLQQSVAALPGVEAVGLITELPLAGQSADRPFRIEGRPEPLPGQSPHADIRAVNHDYFRAMRIPLLKGRYFTEAEVRDTAKVVLISEELARLYFAGEDAVGQRLFRGTFGKAPYEEIIGVVGDIRHRGLDSGLRQTIYSPYLGLGFTNLVIRTANDPVSLAAALRREVAAIDPNQPVANIKTMERWVSESVAQPRFRTLLLGLFSAMALLLSMVGVYGVMSYAVSQRTHELGIRMALGARAGDVLRLVIRQGMKLALAGVAIGLGAAFALTRLIKDLLFGVRATDPMTFAAIALLLAGVALLACYLPARRATKVDPMIALRHE